MCPMFDMCVFGNVEIEEPVKTISSYNNDITEQCKTFLYTLTTKYHITVSSLHTCPYWRTKLHLIQFNWPNALRIRINIRSIPSIHPIYECSSVRGSQAVVGCGSSCRIGRINVNIESYIYSTKTRRKKKTKTKTHDHRLPRTTQMQQKCINWLIIMVWLLSVFDWWCNMVPLSVVNASQFFASHTHTYWLLWSLAVIETVVSCSMHE